MQYFVVMRLMCFLTTKSIRGPDNVLETVVIFDLRLHTLSNTHNMMPVSYNLTDQLKSVYFEA